MTKKQRQMLIESLRRIKVGCEEGERLARLIPPLDIGPLDPDRAKSIAELLRHLMALTDAATLTRDALGLHLGAQTVLNRAKYPRAKPLSRSKS